MEDDSSLSEDSPLLATSSPSSFHRKTKPLNFGGECLNLFGNTIPISISFGLQTLVQAASVLIVSRLGSFDQAVASYSYMFISTTGYVVAVGGAAALDTLCSQAFSSANSPDEAMMVYLQQGCLILSVLFIIFVAPLWWSCNHLFQALGQEEAFAQSTGMFVRVSIPGGVFLIIGECMKRVLQIQGRSTHVTCCIAAATVIGIAMNYVLVVKFGLLGASLGVTMYNLCIVLFLGALISTSSWTGFTKKVFSDWVRHTRLAVIGIFTVGSEVWSFQIIAMMAATLDEVSVEAHGILMVCESIFATISTGHSIATSMRTGNLLGMGDPNNTRFFVDYIAYFVGLIIGMIECIIITSTRTLPGRAFSSNAAAGSLAAKILPLMAVFQLFDVENGAASGILRGAGKNHQAGISNVVSYYGPGLVLAWFLGFYLEWGLMGLWVGIITGNVVLLVLQAVLAGIINWDQETEILKNRLLVG